MKILEILQYKPSHILTESYSTAKQVFGREGSLEDVTKRLAQFKDLSQRNILKPEEKDLTRWIKSGWSAFNDFVSQAVNRKSGNEQKKAVKGDSIRVHETDEWLVVIPLTKDASCFYGKDTQWCTAATRTMNHFDSYFNDTGITIFYFINKKDGEKYAAALNGENIECFDERDNAIHVSEFSAITGVKPSQLERWQVAHSSTMNNSRRFYSGKKKVEELLNHVNLFKRSINRNMELFVGYLNSMKRYTQFDKDKQLSLAHQYEDDKEMLDDTYSTLERLYSKLIPYRLEATNIKEDPSLKKLLDDGDFDNKLKTLLDICGNPMKYVQDGPTARIAYKYDDPW